MSKYRYDRNVLPRVLAILALPMMCVVQVGNGCSQGLDARCGTILSSIHRDVNLRGPLETPFDIIVDLGRSLTQVGPGRGVICKAMFVCSLGTPHHSG